jgi:hypothetical protein
MTIKYYKYIIDLEDVYFGDFSPEKYWTYGTFQVQFGHFSLKKYWRTVSSRSITYLPQSKHWKNILFHNNFNNCFNNNEYMVMKI